MRPCLPPASLVELAWSWLVGAGLIGASLLCSSCEQGAPAHPRSPDELPDGFWFDTRFDQGAASLPEELREQVQRLERIGYAGGYEPAQESYGVVRHDAERAQAGWNLYSSGHAPEAFLIDMQGEVRHRWSYAYGDLPGALPMEHPSQNAWRRVELLPDGDLLAIHEGLGLLRIGKNSKLRWYWPGNAHHDLTLTPSGNVLVLARRPAVLSRWNPRAALLEDFIVELDPDGQEVRRVSVYAALGTSRWADRLRSAATAGGDVLHTNSLELVQPAMAERLPQVQAGQALVCLREIPAICTIDLERGIVTWLRSGNWGQPHEPTQLPNGELLLFDNMGNQGYSRLLQLAPESGEVTWSYGGDPARSFYSIFCGAARRLANGNTLASVSCAGEALEISPDGEIVWRFVSPHRAGPESELVAALFEVQRLGPDELDWLD